MGEKMFDKQIKSLKGKIDGVWGKTRYGILGLADDASAFIAVVVTVAIGAFVLNVIQTTFTVNSTPYNITGTGLTSLSNMASLLPALAVVVVAAYVIFLLARSFGQARQ